MALASWIVLLDADDLSPPLSGEESTQPVASVALVSEASSDIVLEAAPNPFNPSTTIQFQLPDETRVWLTIYNLLGQKVRTFMQAELQFAGEYAIVWDGRDDLGRSSASGLYIVRLKTDERPYIKKLLMIR